MVFQEDRIELSFGADIRYVGQSSELTVPMDPNHILIEGFSALEKAFHDTYNYTYGYTNDESVEIVNIPFLLGENRLIVSVSRGSIDSWLRPTSLTPRVCLVRRDWFICTNAYACTNCGH